MTVTNISFNFPTIEFHFSSPRRSTAMEDKKIDKKTIKKKKHPANIRAVDHLLSAGAMKNQSLW